MLEKIKKKFYNFIENDKQYPVLSGLAAGLYPILYYYGFNFTFVNSWNHLSFFIIYFLLIPVSVLSLLYFLTKKAKRLKKVNKYVLSCLGIGTFAFLTVISTYGINYLLITIVVFIAILLGVLLHKFTKKIIVFQLLLALIVSVKLISHVYHYTMSSEKWMEQNDDIEQIALKIKPNIYVIQPDGYIGFSEVNELLYNYDNFKFKQFLESKEFKIYPNYRSNYYSTLSSNASLFAMKHHYFNNPKYTANELYGARKIIAGKNPVISILNANDYKTNLLLETSYLLVNKPKLFYNYTNINYDKLSNLSRGFDYNSNLKKELQQLITTTTSASNFYFIEKIVPGHISDKNKTEGKEKEREKYLERLDMANTWIREIIEIIETNDKNALIIISADHGGFVGLDHSIQCREKQEDERLVKSIFSSLLAVKSPKGFPQFDYNINSAVNLFRTLFSYLSMEEKYLKELQPNESYTLISDGDMFGAYKVITNEGIVVFEEKK